MPSYRDIYLNLYGVWRLLHFDKAGLGWFDASLEGFWKSFFAAALVLPVFVLGEVLLPSELPVEAASAAAGTKAAANTVVYAYMWVLFPFVMLFLTDAMGRSERYLRFIVVYNWAAVWQSYFLLPAIMFTVAGGSPAVLMIALLMVYAFSWFIARIALDIPGLAALGIVGIDIFLSFVLFRLKVFLLT